jgi:hypothetical protein
MMFSKMEKAIQLILGNHYAAHGIKIVSLCKPELTGTSKRNMILDDIVALNRLRLKERKQPFVCPHWGAGRCWLLLQCPMEQ